MENTRFPPKRSSYDEEEKVLSRGSNAEQAIKKILGNERGDDENDPENFCPIGSLSLTNTNWIILVRVIDKHIRTYKNQRGEGTVMNFVLSDSEKCTIQMTAFNKTVEQFQDLIEKGKCYRISNGNLQVSNKKFTKVPHDLCIMMNSGTRVEPVNDIQTIESNVYSFK